MDALRWQGDIKKIHLCRGDEGSVTVCGLIKWRVAERWPAELGVPTGTLCKECREIVEADARYGRRRKPRHPPLSVWEARRRFAAAHPRWDPMDPLGLIKKGVLLSDATPPRGA